MSEICFSNLKLAKDTAYFLYIGELKNYGLNLFLRDALSRIYNRKIGFIAIIPDVLEQYNYENIVVINPLARSYECRFGRSVHCRVSGAEFMTAVSESRQVRGLIQNLLSRQERLFIYLYESKKEMTLDEIPGVSILGPDKHAASRLNSKACQYLSLKDQLPIMEFEICEGLESLIRTCDSLWKKWGDGIFVSSEYSAAGVNSIIATSAEDITRKFKSPDGTYVMSRYIPHRYDPTVLGVVAGKEDVYVAGVADQRIEEGTKFTGSVFPSVLSKETQDRLKEHTVTAGRWLAMEGYRGIFGCDYLVGGNGEIKFLEVNARKQGTSFEFCCTLEQSLPPGSPMLPELEYYAVMHGVFPVNTVEMNGNPKNLHWGTFNYKVRNTVLTEAYIPQSSQEREAFQRVADGSLKKDFLILEHAGSDIIVAQGSFIARVVAVGTDPGSILQGLRQGQRTIDLTISDRQFPAEMSRRLLNVEARAPRWSRRTTVARRCNAHLGLVESFSEEPVWTTQDPKNTSTSLREDFSMSSLPQAEEHPARPRKIGLKPLSKKPRRATSRHRSSPCSPRSKR